MGSDTVLTTVLSGMDYDTFIYKKVWGFFSVWMYHRWN